MRVSFFRFLLLVSIALVFFGCASYKSIMVNPELVDMDYSQRTLAIFPTYSSDIVIHNPKDVKDDFPNDSRDPNMVIASMLNVDGYTAANSIFANIRLQEIADSCTFSPATDPTKFMSISLDVPDDMSYMEKKVFYVPTVETMRSVGLTDDVVLYINHLETAKEFIYTGQSSQGMLAGYVDFIIWDYWQNKPISWGSYRTTANFVFVCSHSTWEYLIREVIKTTCAKTKFLGY